MQYYDARKILDDAVGAYFRVSSIGQNMNTQIALADAYISNQNIDLNKVTYYKDDNVSANKLTIEKRPALMKLLDDIRLGKIKTVIVYHRDRLARNFYEFVSLIKEFYKYNIKVIYTAEGQPPFSDVLAIESLYGVFAQNEGKNIVRRTSDTRKQFPAQAFGYIRTGVKKDTKYVPDPVLIYDIKSFFNGIVESKTPNDLFQTLMKYKSTLNNKNFPVLLNYLRNPFYAGRIRTPYGYDVLHHVKPIISFEEFLEVQEVIELHQENLLEAINKSSNNGLIHPLCSICKTNMVFRSPALGESGYYVCSKKHSKIMITVEDYNQTITNQLSEVLDNISTEKIKKDVFKHLRELENKHIKEIEFLDRKLKEYHKQITQIIGPNQLSIPQDLISEAREIKERISNHQVIMIRIEESRKGINEVIDKIKSRLVGHVLNYDLYFLMPLFFSSIEVSSDALIYHVAFGDYLEESGEKDAVGA
jgi:site-specific DNA recombinase